MIRSQFTLIAEFQREGDKGKVDFLGIFDRIFASAVPAQHRNLVFVVLLVTDDEPDLGKKQMRFTIVRPNRELLLEQRGEVDFKPGGGSWLASARLAFALQGMPVPEYGKYRFVLELNGREVTSHPLTVTPPPQSSQPPPLKPKK